MPTALLPCKAIKPRRAVCGLVAEHRAPAPGKMRAQRDQAAATLQFGGLACFAGERRADSQLGQLAADELVEMPQGAFPLPPDASWAAPLSIHSPSAARTPSDSER